MLWFFVPAFHVLVFAGIGLLFIALFAFLAYRIATRKPSSQHIALGDLSSVPEAAALPPAAPPSLPDRLRAIDWFQFEKLVAAIYEAKGFSVFRSGGAKPDGGVDLFIEKNGTKTAVQCKHWKSSDVTVRQIREFLGALKDAELQNGIFITLNGYTPEAKALATKHQIAHLGESELIRLLESLDWRYNPGVTAALNNTRKFCPKCESQMVLRTARRGSNPGNRFWGCSAYPRCHYILNLA